MNTLFRKIVGRITGYTIMQIWFLALAFKASSAGDHGCSWVLLAIMLLVMCVEKLDKILARLDKVPTKEDVKVGP